MGNLEGKFRILGWNQDFHALLLIIGRLCKLLISRVEKRWMHLVQFTLSPLISVGRLVQSSVTKNLTTTGVGGFFLARTYQKTYPNIDEYEPRNTQKSIPRFLILHDPASTTIHLFQVVRWKIHLLKVFLSYRVRHIGTGALCRAGGGCIYYGGGGAAMYTENLPWHTKSQIAMILNLFKSPFLLRNSIYVQT